MENVNNNPGLEDVYRTCMRCMWKMMEHGNDPETSERVVYYFLKDMEPLMMEQKFKEVISQLEYSFLSGTFSDLVKNVINENYIK
jgi:hypothetical protein